MATTQLDVCNYSLALVGAEDISQAELTAATVKRARLCAIFYTVILKDALKTGYWSFAKVVDELTLVTSPAIVDGGWTYRFALPTDYLQSVSLHYTDNGGKIPDARWEVMDEYLYCEAEEISLKYIKYVIQPDDWAADFARYLRYALAVELSYPLSGSNEQFARLEAKLEKLYNNARYNSAKENGKRTARVDDFTKARQGFA